MTRILRPNIRHILVAWRKYVLLGLRTVDRLRVPALLAVRLDFSRLWDLLVLGHGRDVPRPADF
jgi:hypothetical protein